LLIFKLTTLEILEGLALVLAGVAAGFLNVVAGGGSMLTLPLLIFMGLPPAMANGTNRIAILWQNIFAIQKFRKAGIIEFPYSIYLGLAAVPGAVLGSFLAIDLKGAIFTKTLAVIMLIIGGLIVFAPPKKAPSRHGNRPNNTLPGVLAFFLIGIYGGFIHAGVGFFMVFILERLHHCSLAKVNSIKVTVAFIFTLTAVLVFIYNQMINWQYGLTLALGNSAGGWLGSHFSVKKGDKWIKAFLLATIIVLSIKLWFYT